jgi:uncharacterized protein (TIGR02145 family)
MKVRSILWLLLIAAMSCEPENSPPEAAFTVLPPSGTVLTVFDLDAGTTEDADGLKTLLTFRWDCDGDGTWDTPFGPWRLFVWQFKQPGTYTVRLQVKDGNGAVGEKESTVEVVIPQTMTDPRDGQVYPVVRFGNTLWLAANLDIGKPVDASQELQPGNEIEKYIYPGGGPGTGYGGLYTWEELMAGEQDEGVQGICPPGWRVPAVPDWNRMLAAFRRLSTFKTFSYKVWGEKFVPDQTVTHDNFNTVGAAQRLLKETGSTGFDALFVGYRDPDGKFGDKDYYFPGHTASFWTSTKSDSRAVRIRIYQTGDYESDLFRFNDHRGYGFSVRCIKDTI